MTFKKGKVSIINGYLLVAWTSETVASADKSGLQAAIDSSPDISIDTLYYHSDDRYNGNSTYTISPSATIHSFWGVYQSKLAAAETVNSDSSATQVQVDAAKTELTAAIANLIPTANVNATGLYEAIALAGTKVQSNYSVSSWSAMTTQLTAAQTMLSSLYDLTTHAPTATNVADYQTTVDAQTTALTSTITALEVPANNYKATDAQWAYKNINVLANGLFNPSKLNQADYTTDSWSAFTAARTAALAFLAAHSTAPAPGIGTNEAQTYVNAYKALWTACYQTLKPAQDISASLAVVDSYAVFNGGMALEAAGDYGVLTLPVSTSTLGDALNKATGVATIDTSGRVEDQCGIAVYINGVFVFSPDMSSGNPAITSGYESIQLHNGDKVLLAVTAKPTFTNMSGSLTPYSLSQMGTSAVRYGALYNGTATDTATVEAGKPLSLTAKAAFAMLNDYPATDTAVANASVYVSGCFTSETDARTAAFTTDTGALTGTGGAFNVTLYSDGWYLLSVFDKTGDYTAMTNFSPVLVHVMPTTNLTAVKTNLQSMMDAVYNAYPSGYYKASDWEAIQSAYTTGSAGIAAATTSGGAAAAQQTALAAITAIQTTTISANTTLMNRFTGLLNRLPDDMTKLDSSLNGLIGGYTNQYNSYESGLIDAYNALTDYLMGQLTQVQLNKYTAIVAAYGDGTKLPDRDPYKLTLKVQADTDEATAVIQDMMTYLQENGAKQEIPVGNKFNAIDTFDAAQRSSSYHITDSVGTDTGYGTVSPNVTAAHPDYRVTLMADPGYAAYALMDAEGLSGGPNTISSDGGKWSISIGTLKRDEIYNNTYYNMTGSVVVTILGKAYTLQSVSFSGIDGAEQTYSTQVAQMNVDGTMLGRAVRFPNALYRFAMPYNDVTITMTWAPADGSGDQTALSAAKDSAKSTLTTAYGTYKQSDYSDTNWTTLTQAYNNGLSAIDAAVSLDAVTSARQTALAAMAVIKTTAQENGTPNSSNKDLPDYGNVVGKVHIIIENQTFKNAATDGSMPAWSGTLVDGWYDLCQYDTVMTSVLKALQLKGCHWSTGSQGSADLWDDYSVSYLASVKVPEGVSADGGDFMGAGNLAEFSGEAGSGWMGSLNDFMVNMGFSTFGYQNGWLTNGDEIHIMYSQNLGMDLGASWGGSDTSLSDLSFSTGNLKPAFSSSQLTYGLIIPGATQSLTVTPTAVNKNFLVKTFLNNYNADSAYYKRTETLTVKPGDTVYVGCGEYDWPSMNKIGAAPGYSYTATKYAVKVYNSMSAYTQDLIAALPAVANITMSNYTGYKTAVSYARSSYDSLTTAQKASLTNLAVLTAVEARITYFSQIDSVKALLAVIPSASTITKSNMTAIAAQVKAARAAYDGLSTDQQMYFTVAAVANYNAAIKKLTELGAFDTSSAPSTITGSDKEPETGTVLTPAVTATNGSAAVVLGTADLTDAIKEAKEKGGAITIAPAITGIADKVTVELPTSSVASIGADTNAALTIQTPVGSITLSNATLDSIVSQASGSTVTVNLGTVDKTMLTADQQKAVGTNTVYDISILSGGNHISSFGGERITIILPYTLQTDEKPEGVAVWHLNDAGKLERVVCTYDKATSLTTFTMPHLSKFLVGYDAWINPFTDVKSDDWFFAAVKYAGQKDLMHGTSASTFGPNDGMTRAMLVTVLYRLEGNPAAVGTNSFTDVKNDQWYTDAVLWANANKIVFGYGNGVFGTNDAVTREQMAMILLNYAKYRNYDVTKTMALTGYIDASSISAWAVPAMQWAVAEGFISGTTPTTLSPAEPSSRAQVAMVLMRFVENTAQ